MRIREIFLTLILLFSVIVVSGCITSKQTRLSIIGVTGISDELNLAGIKELSNVSGTSEYQNSIGGWDGKGLYKGVPISVFAEKVGGIKSGDILIVTSKDNYSQIFPYENIYPSTEWEALQGTMILAYEFNNKKVPDWKDGIRIVFLPSDSKYSNEDCYNTSSLESKDSFASSKWVKHVIKLEFKRDDKKITFGRDMLNYTLSLEQVMKCQSITDMGSFIKSTGTIIEPHNYTGVNLTFIIDKLIGNNKKFGLEVTASDGYKMKYSEEQFWGNVPIYDINGDQIGHGGSENLTLILAYCRDGIPLSAEIGGPFRLAYVGPNSPITDGHFWTKYVSFINLTCGFNDWTIKLSGIDTVEIGRDIFDSITFCPSGGVTHYASYNYTDSTGRKIKYEGFPLYLAIAIVDSPHSGHYYFNLEQAIAGYDIIIKSENSSSIILNSSYITQNTDIILVHMKNGIPLSEDEFPVCLIDKNLPEPILLKQIKSITMVNISEITLNFDLKLTGLDGNQSILNASDYFFIASCYAHHVSVNIENDIFRGIPLFVLIAVIDGNDTSEHYYDFNWNLAKNPGYNIIVIGYDNKNITLSSQEIAGNMSIIIAYFKNDELLHSTEGPLSLQSPWLTLLERIQNIIEIKLVSIDK